jgi:GNAT superfamily N-acetyltransferase
MQGYIACEGMNPIGWCGAAPRPLLHALDDEPIPNAESVGTIVCFLVAPEYRGKGVARLLLQAACTC